MTFGSALASRLENRSKRKLWENDPKAWCRDRLGEHVWSVQEQIMLSVDENERTAVPSCNGSGKSHIASRIISRFIDINPPGTAFVFTTAPRAQQVKAILWRYIRRAHKAAGLPGKINQGEIPEWYINGELVGFGRKPADVDAETVMGLHELKMLIVLDEADGISAALWDAIESLMTNDMGCSVLAIGNPLDNSSRFARICDGTDPGWNVIRISAYDMPAFTGEWVPEDMAARLTSKRWVEDKKRRWGEQNPLYIGKVLGQHPDSDEALIKMSWIRAAQDRWEDWQEIRRASPVRIEPPGRRIYSVDVARFGEDRTAITARQGDIVNPDGEETIETHAKLDTTQTAGLMTAKLRGHPGSHGVVDVIGVGAGVYDQLNREGWSVTAFNGSRKTRRRDSTGEWKFANLRSASWYHMAELLDPSMSPTLALPPDDDLAADLATPTYEPRAGGVIYVESKEDSVKRLGRSPDAGDSCVMACWTDDPGRGVDQEYAAAHEHDEPLEHADAYDPRSDHPPVPASGIQAWGHGDEDTWSSF